MHELKDIIESKDYTKLKKRLMKERDKYILEYIKASANIDGIVDVLNALNQFDVIFDMLEDRITDEWVVEEESE